MTLIRILQPLGGKPTGSIIDVTEGVAEQLTTNGSAAPVTK